MSRNCYHVRVSQFDFNHTVITSLILKPKQSRIFLEFLPAGRQGRGRLRRPRNDNELETRGLVDNFFGGGV